MDDPLLIQTIATPLWMYAVYAGVVVVVLVLLVWVIAKIKKRLTRPEMYGLTREQMAKRWQQVRQTASQGVMGSKLALLEADTLLDSALKSLAMPGETLGERLKVACYKYPKLRNVWWAHKLRNQLAHDSSFQLTTRQAQQAIDEFERALKTLNVM